jgi:GntR family transcriptional regulator
MALAGETEKVQLPPGTPVVEITRVAYTGDGTPVGVNEMTADAGSCVFRYEFGDRRLIDLGRSDRVMSF